MLHRMLQNSWKYLKTAIKHFWSLTVGFMSARSWELASKSYHLIYIKENKGNYREHIGYGEQHAMGRAGPQSQYCPGTDTHLLMLSVQHWREVWWILGKMGRWSNMKSGWAIFSLEANSHLHATGNKLNLLRKAKTGCVNWKCHQQTPALRLFLLVLSKFKNNDWILKPHLLRCSRTWLFIMKW